jgi:hypothetical protein
VLSGVIGCIGDYGVSERRLPVVGGLPVGGGSVDRKVQIV